jgi:hypothetical protein
MVVRTTRLAGANAIAGETFIVIRSPAPTGNVVAAIRIPKKHARNIIGATIATVVVAQSPETSERRHVVAALRGRCRNVVQAPDHNANRTKRTC